MKSQFISSAFRFGILLDLRHFEESYLGGTSEKAFDGLVE
jgi:hypothetical protein